MAKKRPNKPEYPVAPEKFGQIMADIARADELARAGDKRFQGRIIGDPQSQAPADTDGLSSVSTEEAARIFGSLGEADSYAACGNTRLWGMTIGQWPPPEGKRPGAKKTDRVADREKLIVEENLSVEDIVRIFRISAANARQTRRRAFLNSGKNVTE